MHKSFFEFWESTDSLKERGTFIVISWGCLNLCKPCSKHEKWEEMYVFRERDSFNIFLCFSNPASKYNTKKVKMLLPNIPRHHKCHPIYPKRRPQLNIQRPCLISPSVCTLSLSFPHSIYRAIHHS